MQLISQCIPKLYMMQKSPQSIIKQAFEFDCPICCESYDDGPRFPMMLCISQHSCCLSCVSNVIYKKTLEVSQCPFCKSPIKRKDITKFRLLHEIKETAHKLKIQNGKINGGQQNNTEKLQELIAKERQKNAWLIQQMKERDNQWVKRLFIDSRDEQALRQELNMKKFQINHLNDVIYEQTQQILQLKLKENTLINEKIKIKMDHIHHSPPIRRIKLSDFLIIKCITKSQISQILIVKHKTLGFICSLKVLQKKKVRELQLYESILREIKVASMIDHPNIIKMYGYFADQAYIYLLYEYAIDSTLQKQINNSAKLNAPTIIRQLIIAEQQFAAHSISHNSIDPQSIMLTFNDVVKIGCLGWATVYDAQKIDLINKDLKRIAIVAFTLIFPDKKINNQKQLSAELNKMKTKKQAWFEVIRIFELLLSDSKEIMTIIQQVLKNTFLKIN